MTGISRLSQADPTGCDREPIHLPGSIQPHGCLLVLHPVSGEIIQLAGDVSALIGTSKERVMGATLAKMIGETSAAKVLALLPAPCSGPPARRSAQVEVSVGDHKVDAIIHLSQQFPVVELQPALRSGLAPGELIMALERILGTLDTAQDVNGCCRVATDQIRALTGFDRVMIYRFLSDGSGVVIAEDRCEGMDSYLDLHYPESDIPKQARALYCKNWVRLIPDVDYKPAPLT
jgi:two-component system, chemotaxis family, sensor kinase Cph1